MTADSRPKLGVVYDEGAAGPGEVTAAARSCGIEVLLIVDGATEHVRRLLPALRRRFTVCEVTGLGVDRAAATVAALGLAGVLTFSEHRMEETAAYAATAGLDRWHSPEVTSLLTDKLRQRQALAAAGVPGAAFASVDDPAAVAEALARVGLPAVLKPRRGTGSRLVRRVDTVAEARAATAEIAASVDCGLVVEGLLPGDTTIAGPQWGDYVSVEAAVHGGQAHVLCLTGKFPLVPPFRERGSFVPHTLDAVTADRVAAVAVAAVTALGVRDGLVHTEVKLTPDGPRVIEVNGRLGGLVADIVRRGSGVDLVAAAMRLALGRPVRDTPRFAHVTYQYTLVPAAHSASTPTADRLARLRALPGVDLVDARTRPDRAGDWRDGARARVGHLHGRVTDHPALAQLTQAIDGV